MFRCNPFLRFGLVLAIATISCAKQDTVVISGRFIVASTSQPYEYEYPLHILVNCTLDSGKRTGLNVDALKVERDGQFRIMDVPSSIQKIEFHSNQFRGDRKTIDPLNGKSIGVISEGKIDIGDISLPLGKLVHVRVIRPKDIPVKNADVILTAKSSIRRDRGLKTNEEGECLFGGFEPGPAVITATAHRDRDNDWVPRESGVAGVTVEFIIEDKVITEVELQIPAQ